MGLGSWLCPHRPTPPTHPPVQHKAFEVAEALGAEHALEAAAAAAAAGHVTGGDGALLGAAARDNRI